jgi:hypothetical protein
MKMRTVKTALSLFLLACTALPAGAQSGFKDLVVRLRVDKARYLAGEPAWAEVRLSNPDSVLLMAWLSPGLAAVGGIQVFSSDGAGVKEIGTHCWDSRINTPVTLAVPPRKTGFLSRLELSRCFGDEKERNFLPGRYGLRARFTNVNGDQAVSDSASFEVAAPEGPEKELYGEILRTRGSRLEKLCRKNSQSAYAPLLAMRYFGGATAKGGRKTLRRGIELCRDLIAREPDRVSSAVLVDSLAALSGRLAGAGTARKNLEGIVSRHPGTAASEAAGAALARLGDGK